MLLPLAKNRKPLKGGLKKRQEKWGRTQSVPRILSQTKTGQGKKVLNGRKVGKSY